MIYSFIPGAKGKTPQTDMNTRYFGCLYELLLNVPVRTTEKYIGKKEKKDVKQIG